MFFLRQSTACTVNIGPFLDNTTAAAETGLTITQSDIRLSKNGGNMAQKNESTSCTHDESGFYTCPLNTTDTNTLGRLRITASISGVLPVREDFMVVTANFYDTMCSTDLFDVNVYDKTGFSLAVDQSAVTVGTTNTVGNKTGFSLSSAGVAAIWDEALSGHTTTGTSGLALANLLKIGKNKWAYSGTTFTIYDDNGTSALYQFTLDSADTPTSRTPV